VTAGRDSSGLRTLWQRRQSGGAPYKRVTDDFYVIRMMGDYICYWSDKHNELMKLNKESGNPTALLASPCDKVTEDDAYVTVGDMLYVSNYKGELWRLPFKNPVNGAMLLDQWGPYDDDDFAPWITSDGAALYWFAGPNANVRISDDDAGALLKSGLDPRQ
jgi:hypothetical protein